MGERSELREIQKLEGHTDKVWSLAWNPVAGINGTPAILASCGNDNTVLIWMQNPITSTFDCLATIRGAQTGTVRSCSWSPDGDMLAIANYDGTTSIWDMDKNDFKHLYDLEGHKKEVVSVSWNTSGHLATCSSNSVWIWEFTESEEYEYLEKFEHENDVEMVQWHPFKDILFSCGCDEIIKVWERFSDHDHWRFAEDLEGHMSKVCSISFNATGDKMVTSSADLSIKVWGEERMQRGGGYQGGGYQPWKHLYTLSGYHKQTIFSVHWSSDGIIASGAADGAICLFEENRSDLSPERRGAMHKLLLTKEKAHEMNVNSVQWAPKTQEGSQSTRELLLTKEKVRETDVNSVQWGPKERSEAMHGSFLTKEKAQETDVNLVQQSPKLLETNKAMDKLLLTKEKTNETVVTTVQWAAEVNSPKVTGKKRSYENLVQWAPKLQERSEAMPEFLLTEKNANEMDVKSGQQVPKLQEKCNDMLKLLLPKEKVNEREVTTVRAPAKDIGLLASASDDGTVKIWKLTSRQ